MNDQRQWQGCVRVESATMVPDATDGAEHIEVHILNRLGRPLFGVLTLSAAGTAPPIATFGVSLTAGRTTACLCHDRDDRRSSTSLHMVGIAAGLTVTLRVDDAGRAYDDQCLVRAAAPLKRGRRANVTWRSVRDADGRSSSGRLALSVDLA